MLPLDKLIKKLKTNHIESVTLSGNVAWGTEIAFNLSLDANLDPDHIISTNEKLIFIKGDQLTVWSTKCNQKSRAPAPIKIQAPVTAVLYDIHLSDKIVLGQNDGRISLYDPVTHKITWSIKVGLLPIKNLSHCNLNTFVASDQSSLTLCKIDDTNTTLITSTKEHSASLFAGDGQNMITGYRKDFSTFTLNPQLNKFKLNPKPRYGDTINLVVPTFAKPMYLCDWNFVVGYDNHLDIFDASGPDGKLLSSLNVDEPIKEVWNSGNGNFIVYTKSKALLYNITKNNISGQCTVKAESELVFDNVINAQCITHFYAAGAKDPSVASYIKAPTIGRCASIKSSGFYSMSAEQKVVLLKTLIGSKNVTNVYIADGFDASDKAQLAMLNELKIKRPDIKLHIYSALDHILALHNVLELQKKEERAMESRQVSTEQKANSQQTEINTLKLKLEQACKLVQELKTVFEQERQANDKKVKSLQQDMVDLRKSIRTSQQNLDDLLWSAADVNQFNRMLSLIELGANLQSVNAQGQTILHRAVIADDIRMTEFVLAHISKSDPNATLLLAVRDVAHKDTETCVLLTNTILFQAVKQNNIELARMALKLGADKNAQENIKGRKSETALHKACHFGHIEMIEFLLLQGCSLTITDRHNQTPIEVTSDPKIKQMITDHEIRNKNAIVIQAAARGMFARRELKIAKEKDIADLRAKSAEVYAKLGQEGKSEQIIELANAIKQNRFDDAKKIIGSVLQSNIEHQPASNSVRN